MMNSSPSRLLGMGFLSFLIAWLATAETSYAQSYTLDRSTSGSSLYSEILGSNAHQSASYELAKDSSYRGPIGGLYADTYNWKTLGGIVGGAPATSLQFLQNAAAQNSSPLITVNARGLGTGATYSNFSWPDNGNTSQLSKLAADWVRYTNFILQGAPLTAADQQLLSEMTWSGAAPTYSGALPAVLGSTPRVEYWEIGNEPDVPTPPGHAMTGALYAQRYLAIANAMKQIDPTIKVGPVTTTLHPGQANAIIPALKLNVPVDFISFHPYFWAGSNTIWNNVANMELAMRYVRVHQNEIMADMKQVVREAGRDPEAIEYIASEWSSVGWQSGPWQSSMLAAIGNAETIFAFAANGIRMANHWADHTLFHWDRTPYATRHLFDAMNKYLGDEVVYDIHDDPQFNTDANHRLYMTRDSQSGRMAIWGLNFDNDDDLTLDLGVLGLSSEQIESIQQFVLDDTGGPGGLMARNNSNYVGPGVGTNVYTGVRWTESDMTNLIDLADFQWTLPNASISLLVFTPLQTVPEPSCIAMIVSGLAATLLWGIPRTVTMRQAALAMLFKPTTDASSQGVIAS